MPLESSDLKHLQAAEGFLTLGMYHDALVELEEIDPFSRTVPEVLKVRLEIYGRTKKWHLMEVVAGNLVGHDPGNPQWVILLAYATRRCTSIGAAKKILITALRQHPDEPIIHYNLGCYDCQMGNIAGAKTHLRRSFELQSQCRAIALDDPDLEPLWKEIADN
jgi:uncharacterized protein HemY